MSESTTELDREVEALRAEVAELRSKMQRLQRGHGIRKRSKTTILGLPLYEIATGPDLETGEVRGHARAIVAVGDIATGVIALGGFAQGGIVFGGMALGLVSFGGYCIGVLAALGGLAVGSLAVGGCAIGVVAIGGLAVGQFVAGADGVSPELTQALTVLKTIWEAR